MSLGMVLRSGKVVGENVTQLQQQNKTEIKTPAENNEANLTWKQFHLVTKAEGMKLPTCNVLSGIYQSCFNNHLPIEFKGFGNLPFASRIELITFSSISNLLNLCYYICPIVATEASVGLPEQEKEIHREKTQLELRSAVVLDILKILYYGFRFSHSNPYLCKIKQNAHFYKTFLGKLDESIDDSFVGKNAQSTSLYHEIRVYAYAVKRCFSKKAIKECAEIYHMYS